MKIALIDGNEYEFAPLRFTREACDLLEAQEQLEDGKLGKFAQILRVNMLASLVDGGLSPEAAEAAVCQVPLVLRENSVLTQILKAMVGE